MSMRISGGFGMEKGGGLKCVVSRWLKYEGWRTANETN
jgi:hypothetical protein